MGVNDTRLRRKGPLCRYCRKPVGWQNIRIDDREIQPHVFERVYYCPHCRSILEYASWQTGTQPPPPFLRLPSDASAPAVPRPRPRK